MSHPRGPVESISIHAIWQPDRGSAVCHHESAPWSIIRSLWAHQDSCTHKPGNCRWGDHHNHGRQASREDLCQLDSHRFRSRGTMRFIPLRHGHLSSFSTSWCFSCRIDLLQNAYAADLTTPASRNIAFAYLHGCLFLGIAIGPIFAGLIVKWTGSPLSMFYISLSIHVTFALFMALIAPESLSKARQLIARSKHHDNKAAAGSSSDWIDHLRALNMLEPLKVLWPTGEGTSAALRRNLVFLAAVDTILFGVAMGSMTVVIYYANFQFGWGTYESGVLISVVNTCRVLCLIVVLPLVTRYVRGKSKNVHQRSSGSDTFDLSVIRVAVFFDTLGYVGYSLARTGPLLLVSACIASIGGIGSPTLQAALTKHVPPHQTGQLLGASGLLHALARVIAPTIFNGIYAATVGKFTQTVFVCLASTFFLAFILSWFLKAHGKTSLIHHPLST